jgi:hypothetical protein
VAGSPSVVQRSKHTTIKPIQNFSTDTSNWRCVWYSTPTHLVTFNQFYFLKLSPVSTCLVVLGSALVVQSSKHTHNYYNYWLIHNPIQNLSSTNTSNWKRVWCSTPTHLVTFNQILFSQIIIGVWTTLMAGVNVGGSHFKTPYQQNLKLKPHWNQNLSTNHTFPN